MKHNKKGRSKGTGRYVQLHHWLLDSAAWRNLDGNARAIYIELAKRYAGPGSNNGRIAYSARQGAEDVKISKDTAARALVSLQAHGFIVLEKRGGFSLKIRHANEYRLTEHPCDLTNKPPTKDFMRWEEKNTVPVVIPTVPVVGPYCPCGDTVPTNTPLDGPCGDTVEARFD